MSTTEPTGSESATTPETQETLRAHACLLCQRRKVKCDRKDPCAACTKARAECIFRVPAPPRRRPRKSPKAMLLARLRRYEELLKGFGVKIEPEGVSNEADVTRRIEDMNIASDNAVTGGWDPTGGWDSHGLHATTGSEGRLQPVERGKMILKNGKTRFLENKLWTHLSDEFMEASDILPVSSEDEDTESQPHEITMDPHGGDLILGSSPVNPDLRSVHPPPIQGFRLWQKFLDNVHPMTHILHAPTVQQDLLEATGDLENISMAMESLVFSIYSSAVYSMSSTECENITGESKPVILNRFQGAVRQALVSAGLLKSSNSVVLQAYVLFLLSMRQRYDSHSLWTLTGVAVRIGQRMGLHRDGVDLKLPPFEIEIRRRLWWQIVILEARASEFSGVGQTIRDMKWTTKLPLNVNDSSLHPSMVELPNEQNGATEMIHCIIRYELGNFMLTQGAKSTVDGSWQKFQSSEIAVTYKEQAIRVAEELMEQEYLKFCDPSIPLHYISSILTRTMFCKMRFRTYHPRHYHGRQDIIQQEEKDMLFSVCVKMLEHDNIIQSSSVIQGFLWHVNSYFQFDALIHVLAELRSRVAGEQVNHAWQQVDEVFMHHPYMLTDTKKGLHVAILRLAVRAWDMYERSSLQNQQVMYQVQTPQFWDILDARTREVGQNPAQEASTLKDQHAPAANTENMLEALGPPFDFNTSPMNSTSMDWTRWDDLLEDFEMNPAGPSF